MKLKLDENLGKSVFDKLVSAGHDVHTVRQEDLCGASDETVYQQCIAESQCLITLDLDFSDPFRFAFPGAGIVIFRRVHQGDQGRLDDQINRLLYALKSQPIQPGLGG